MNDIETFIDIRERLKDEPEKQPHILMMEQLV
jgi:hypothetical protein